MEFLSLSRRRSSARNVPGGEERGETDVFAGYCDCPSSGSLIFGGQIVHINEGKGELTLFSTKDNALPTLFIFIFLLLHNFINFPLQFFYSLLHNFIIFPPWCFYSFLHNFIIFPPHSWIPSLSTILVFPHLLLILFLSSSFTMFTIFPRQSLFPSSSTILFFPPPPPPPYLFYIFFHPQIHRPPIDPTPTPHRPYIDPTSILYLPYIDPTSTPRRPNIMDKADKPKAPCHNPCTCKFCETFKNPRTVRKK